MNGNIIILLALLSFTLSASAQNKVATIDQIAWLEGSWTRTNPMSGQSGFESWKKVSSTELSGRGITMHGNDTVFVETLRITVRDGVLFYVADVPENRNPVYFRITNLDQDGFTCENPDHDFPKKIAYSIQGNSLQATISGNGRTIEYRFERRQ